MGVAEADGFVRTLEETYPVCVPKEINRNDLVGYVVKTNDLGPGYQFGDAGFYCPNDLFRPITSGIVGCECYIIDENDVSLIRVIKKLHPNGTVDLWNYQIGYRKNVRIRRAAPVRWIVRDISF